GGGGITSSNQTNKTISEKIKESIDIVQNKIGEIKNTFMIWLGNMIKKLNKDIKISIFNKINSNAEIFSLKLWYLLSISFLFFTITSFLILRMYKVKRKNLFSFLIGLGISIIIWVLTPI
ncbi:MAG: hypothetical protein AABY22_07795, partial [Nanoarchaeota archaeon]